MQQIRESGTAVDQAEVGRNTLCLSVILGMTTIIQLEQLLLIGYLLFACEKNGLKKLDKSAWSLGRTDQKPTLLIKLIRES